MGELTSLILLLEPVAKARPRVTRQGHCYTPEKTKTFEATLKRLAREQYRNLPIHADPLEVTLQFFVTRPKSVKKTYPIGRPDLDNYIKAVLDALNGIVWHDDSQVIDLRAIKRYATDKPAIHVLVRRITLSY